MSDSNSTTEQTAPPVAPAANQAAASDSTAQVPVSVSSGTGLVVTPLSGTIQALQEGGVRGQAGMLLLQALTGRLESDVDRARDEVKELRAELDATKNELGEERRRSAVLRERLSAMGHVRWFQVFATGLAGVIGGVAVPHLNDPHSGLPVAATGVAVLLLVGGCWPLRHPTEGD